MITPAVLWAGADPTLRPAHDEVLSVYRVSLETLVNARVDDFEQPVFAWS